HRAGHVREKHPLVLPDRRVGEDAASHDARVVHEDVEPTEALQRDVDHRTHVRLAAHIGLDSDRPASALLERRHDLRRARRARGVVDDDGGALDAEREGDRTAEAAAAAGDERHTSVQSPHGHDPRLVRPAPPARPWPLPEPGTLVACGDLSSERCLTASSEARMSVWSRSRSAPCARAMLSQSWPPRISATSVSNGVWVSSARRWAMNTSAQPSPVCARCARSVSDDMLSLRDRCPSTTRSPSGSPAVRSIAAARSASVGGVESVADGVAGAAGGGSVAGATGVVAVSGTDGSGGTVPAPTSVTDNVAIDTARAMRPIKRAART